MYLWLWLETLQSRAFVLPLVLSVLLLPRPSTSRGDVSDHFRSYWTRRRIIRTPKQIYKMLLVGLWKK